MPAKLENADLSSEEFGVRFAHFRQEVRAHAGCEEREKAVEFPALEAGCTTEQRQYGAAAENGQSLADGRRGGSHAPRTPPLPVRPCCSGRWDPSPPCWTGPATHSAHA